MKTLRYVIVILGRGISSLAQRSPDVVARGSMDARPWQIVIADELAGAHSHMPPQASFLHSRRTPLTDLDSPCVVGDAPSVRADGGFVETPRGLTLESLPR